MSRALFLFLVACAGCVGALVGGLLSRWWWDLLARRRASRHDPWEVYRKADVIESWNDIEGTIEGTSLMDYSSLPEKHGWPGELRTIALGCTDEDAETLEEVAAYLEKVISETPAATTPPPGPSHT